jgi:hypothetical protein
MKFIIFPSYVISSTHTVLHVSSVAGMKSLINFVASVLILKTVEGETKHESSKYFHLMQTYIRYGAKLEGEVVPV